MKTAWLAKKLVNHTLGIGQKESPGIKKAVKKYGKNALRTKDKKILAELSQVKYGPLFVKKRGKYALKPKTGHSVVIAHNPANKRLAAAVRRECIKNGAHTLVVERSTASLRESYLLAPTDSLRELSPLSEALHSTADYYINLESVENEFWKKGVPPSKTKAAAPVGMRLHEIRDKRLQRWCLVGWPHPETARELGIPIARFKRIVEGSIAESFSPRTSKLVEGYHRALSGAKSVLIEHDDGTSLEFSVNGRRFFKDDGVLSEDDIANKEVGMNIPCGEVFTAPVEDSANGLLKIPRNIVPGHGIAEGIELFFEKGEVVDYGAKKNKAYLKKFFGENTGECRRIAELGIGCNAKAELTNGYTIVDEKIRGTVHVAIGWNIGYGGRNNASSHLDFIKPMYKGRMYADGALVMDRGRLV